MCTGRKCLFTLLLAAGLVAGLHTFAEEPLPKDFEQKSRERFAKIKDHDGITVEKFVEIDKREFQRQEVLRKNPNLRYRGGRGGGEKTAAMTACGNGDFEQSLDP